MYDKPIRVLFTPEEIQRQVAYKKNTGMTLNAITDKAISCYLDNKLIGREKAKTPQQGAKKLCVRMVTVTVYDKLRTYCSLNGLTLSDVVRRALEVYIDLYSI